MKLRMMIAATFTIVLALGMSISAEAGPWRGHRHGQTPHVAVRVYAPPVPRLLMPPIPVPVVVAGYPRNSYRSCAPVRSRGCYGHNGGRHHRHHGRGGYR